MKKKNLLALSALVLSLGLTISSCAGQPGEKGDQGDKGDTGETGPQGPQGEPGQDGKTYIPVIVVNDDDIVDGTVTQDKYWVEAGQNETVTFTFTPDDPSLDLVVNFEINGTVVEFSPDQTTYTLTVDDSYGAVQVTGALFTNAIGYGETAILGALGTIAGSDHLITSNILDAANLGGNLDYANATFADSLDEIVTKGLESVNKAVTDLGEDATASEKLAASSEAANKVVEELNSTYQDLITSAKEEAKSIIEDKTDDVTNEKYTDEDKTAIENSALASVDAATTLEGISKIVNAEDVTLENGTKFAQGSYITLMDRKETALNALETAFSDLVADEAWLNPESGRPAQEAYNEMVETLKLYGVEVTELPKAVYDNYAAQVSAAAELPLNDKNVVALQAEGVKAIKDTYDGIKDELTAGILASYTEEIDSANSLASASNAKITLKGVVEGTISNFVTDDTAASPKKISDYISAKPAAQNNDVDGLIYLIENALEKAVVDNGLTAFKAERKTNAVNEAVDALLAQAAEINANDKVYASVFGAPVYDENDDVVGYLTTESPLDWDEYKPASGQTPADGYLNPYLESGYKTDETESGDTYVLLSTTGTTSNPYNLVNGSSPSLYETIVRPVGGLKDQLSDSGTIAEIKAQGQAFLGTQKTKYENVVKDFKTKIGTEYVDTITLDNAHYVSETDITNTWTNSKTLTSFDAISDAAEKLGDCKEALETLDSKVYAFVTNADKTETNYNNWFNASTDNTSTFKDAFDDAVEDVVTGSMNLSEVKRFTSDANLKSLYEADVANYLTVTKNWMEQQYQNKYNGALTPSQSDVLTKKYNDLLSLVGHKVKTSTTAPSGYEVDDRAGTVDLTAKTIASVDTLIDVTKEVLGITNGNSGDISSDIPGDITNVDTDGFLNFTVTFAPNAENENKTIKVETDLALTGTVNASEAQVKVGDAWQNLPEGSFGPTDGFPYTKATSELRVKVEGKGTYKLTIKIVDATTNQVLDTISFEGNVDVPTTTGA